MNKCATQDLREADAELDQVYRQLVAKFADDRDGAARIKKAEEAWVAFRDAQVEALFPESDRAKRGSAFPMCRALALTRLTRERTKALGAMLESREGDVCSQ